MRVGSRCVMKKERLVAAPHTFMLSVLLMISIPAAYAIMLISHQESIGAFLRVPGALQVTLLVAVIYLALLVTLFCTRYQWAAVTEICEDRVVFRALFTHRTFTTVICTILALTMAYWTAGSSFGCISVKPQFLQCIITGSIG